MGQATKAGMWCVNEGKPVAAVKTTHGVRNALALPTWGLTAKVERWHCPNCGGPVTKDRRGSETVRLENEEKAKADFANAFDVVATVPEQVLIALREKNANELQKQFGLKKSEVSRAQNLIMEWEVKPDEPSVIAPGAYKPNATRFAQLFQKLGVRVELVPAAYKTTEHSTDEDLQPRAAGSSPEASEDVLAQIEKLGQLHDAGALTDEEFQAKKAELIRRPHS